MPVKKINHNIEKKRKNLEDLLISFPNWMRQYSPFLVLMKDTDIYFTLIIVSSQL